MVNNRYLTKIKIGDTVQLKIKTGKNDVPTAWLVQDISFPKRLLKLKKNSGVETGHGDERWVDFELVERVFPASDRIYQLYWDRSETQSDERKLSEFIARTVLLASTMQSVPTVPPDLDPIIFGLSAPIKPDPEPPAMKIPKDIPTALSINLESDEEEFSTPMTDEPWEMVEAPEPEAIVRRTKSGRISREPIRFQAGEDEVKIKLNFDQVKSKFERAAVGRTAVRKKKSGKNKSTLSNGED